MAITDLSMPHNKAFQSDQFLLSGLLLSLKPRQHALAAEERRYIAEDTDI